MNRLFCIKEIKDPRNYEVMFEEHDVIDYLNQRVDNINGIIPHTYYQNGLNNPSLTEEEIMTFKKANFFEELIRMKSFMNDYINTYFVPLSLYREKQIEDLFNEEK